MVKKLSEPGWIELYDRKVHGLGVQIGGARRKLPTKLAYLDEFLEVQENFMYAVYYFLQAYCHMLNPQLRKGRKKKGGLKKKKKALLVRQSGLKKLLMTPMRFFAHRLSPFWVM